MSLVKFIESDPKITRQKLVKMSGLSESMVDYHINSLKAKKIIKVFNDIHSLDMRLIFYRVIAV